ncbi:MAG: N-acetylneuraminate synthase family protein [Candidatus Eremiobacteraeota bacterium]|nr:N-acetylneuraminate synthase family protein [Candidatus Eremiobacteraeota bacterium]
MQSESMECTAAAESLIPNRLFIFELANNHMGDVDHGIHVIEQFAAVAQRYRSFNFAFKLQYRDLDTFIHPAYQGRMDVKYIKRFSETRLTREESRRLVKAIRANGFVAMCTAFDEKSVDHIVEDGFDILKIGSCSMTDWPLLERVGATSLPIIFSTAGATLEEIDSVVTFMQNRDKDFAVMHCVAEYPTTSDKLALNQIDLLRDRYSTIRIGYSTHEYPSETMPVVMAIAKGCSIFEKHVGVPTEKYPLNIYSATPEQVVAWLDAAEIAFGTDGPVGVRVDATAAERESLLSLRRGAFAARDIATGEQITTTQAFMAIPTQGGHVTANDWSKYTRFFATAPIKKGEPILVSNTRHENVRENIRSIVQRVNAFLHVADIAVPGEAELEISHHFGLSEFDEFGITMITVVNRDYCKKLIVVLPGQKHPEQYHNKKEETFVVLYGVLTMQLDGKERTCKRGSVVTIERGVRHAFESKDGAIFEEISSTHFTDDSFYTDESITRNQDRKTFLRYWLS